MRFVPVLLAIYAFIVPAYGIVVTGTDPNNPIFNGSAFDGVGVVLNNGAICSGSLIGDTTVLTAGHCVTGAGGIVNSPGLLEVRFFIGPTLYAYSISAVYRHPDYVNTPGTGVDLAVLRLTQVADASIDRYGLYLGPDEVGQTGALVGWGRRGTGDTGNQPGTSLTGLRSGTNVYDAFGCESFAPAICNYLGFDFDKSNGTPEDAANANVMGSAPVGSPNPDAYLGLSSNTGSATEVMIAPGDSGGPTFLGGLIAGVHSYQSCRSSGGPNPECLAPPDVLAGLNSSFGELGFDARISNQIDWIQTVADIPEPTTVALMGIGILALGIYRRKHLS